MVKKIFCLLLITSCASHVKKEAITSFSDSHPECKINPAELNLSIFDTTQQAFVTTITGTTSMVFTTLGYATDVAVVGGTVAGTIYLCGEGGGSNCGEMLKVLNGYSSVGNWTYNKTEKWRCPYVDHIAKAIRKSAKCNHAHGHFIEAYEQLDFLATNEMLSNCMSEAEADKRDELKVALKAK